MRTSSFYVIWTKVNMFFFVSDNGELVLLQTNVNKYMQLYTSVRMPERKAQLNSNNIASLRIIYITTHA